MNVQLNPTTSIRASISRLSESETRSRLHVVVRFIKDRTGLSYLPDYPKDPEVKAAIKEYWELHAHLNQVEKLSREKRSKGRRAQHRASPPTKKAPSRSCRSLKDVKRILELEKALKKCRGRKTKRTR